MLKTIKSITPVMTFILIIGLINILNECQSSGSSGSKYITVSNSNPRNIGQFFYGQNYWDWAYTGMDGTESTMADLHLNIYRAGGTTLDCQENGKTWKEAQIDKYIAYCRAISAEPLLTVSVVRNNATSAADWVNYCNNRKGYGIKYWIIGNEPEYYGKYIRTGYSMEDYAQTFNEFATAMKKVDSSIFVIGPESGGDGQKMLGTFLKQCGKTVDIVSFHYYPFGNKGDFSIEKVMADQSLRSKIREIRSTVDTYCGSGKPIALTETHSSWSSIMGEPASAETFYSGLWVADAIGIALEENIWSACLWATNGGYGTGFLDCTNQNKPRPAYYSMQMFAAHFGKYLIQAESPQNMSVYASRNETGDHTILIVINKTSIPQEETIRFRNFPNALPERKYTFPAYSLTCLSVPDNGNAMESWSYTKDLADGWNPPIHN